MTDQGINSFRIFIKVGIYHLKNLKELEVAKKKQENPWMIFGFFDLLEKTFEGHHDEMILEI